MVDPGENIVEAAMRELEEETGFVGPSPQLIGVVSPNPALQNNRCATVFVRDCERVSSGHLDTHEEIDVLFASLSEVDDTFGAVKFTMHWSLRPSIICSWRVCVRASNQTTAGSVAAPPFVGANFNLGRQGETFADVGILLRYRVGECLFCDTALQIGDDGKRVQHLRVAMV